MVITIGAEKGGVSKTRLATHIAALAASQGVDVVLLDTDKQGSAMSWARIRNEEGVTPSIPVLSLPAKPATEIANLAGKYTLVVVDIGAQNYRTMLECAALSDLVLVPCGPDQQEMESTLNVFEALRALDPRHEKGRIPAHVVLTRVSTKENAKATAELRAYLASEDIPVCKGYIAQREAWRATGKTGRALHELKGSDRSLKAIEEMQFLYDEIVELANKE
ncbi:chromosome partitioning protein [Duganella sp. BJB488]|uniref:nucleotide-binding protein n=1 Tax=unclassified Duganella TaxID=2636909 RepID=UPI000E34ADE6|nr:MULTISPECIES: AAA family ATPase [unclassified Duganella]RFP09217.1 chromosome partitioning protein [Duganella sp. BJB475]RFP13292.1 chromosome partitioning protein [Duganella sp. BJB489]RFP17132.1 chromosome partitioning protein [Duganella sp. BJB488]RFP25443.1 chromosome partitioning protein [Duganella sp. BJB476]RFP31649.1 chromosome partitioning protein [Duganella sp. BJB480]